VAPAAGPGFVLDVSLPDGPGKIDLPRQFVRQRARQCHHSVLSAFGAQDRNGGRLQIHVLDSQVHRLRHPQAAAIEQPRHQIGGIAANIAHRSQQRARLGDRRCVAQVSRFRHSQSVHRLEWKAQDILVKKDNGVERLLLRAGSQLPPSG
jgi:hypothetical protein